MGGLKPAILLTLCLLPLLICSPDSNAQFVPSTGFPVDSIIGDAACKIVDCGKGTCNGSADDKPPFFFDCMCDPGWTQMKIGDATLPPCILPNCTLDFSCGSPSAPPPPPPPLLPPINISDPCNFTSCGDGTCKLTSGGGPQIPTCVCNHGSFNLLNLTGLPCLKQCSLGADCSALGLGLSPPPPSPPLPPSVPSDGSRSKGDGSSYSKNDGKWIGGSLALVMLSVSLQFVLRD